MPERKNIFIPDLSGGMVDAVRTSLLKDNECKEVVNYEIIEPGELTKRSQPYLTFDDIVGGLASDDCVADSFVVWYPNNMPELGIDDYVVVVYVSEYRGSPVNYLYLYYQTSSYWARVTLHSHINLSQKPRFFVGSSRLLIAEGSTYPCQYVEINKDGEIYSGELGIKAPLNKIEIDAISDWDASQWEEDSTGDYLGEPGLYQYTYTVVTETGEESNPAPISDTYDAQFFKLEDGINARWVDKIEIKNLSVPNVSQAILDRIKYFNIYRRETNYADGSPGTFTYIQQVEVVDKTIPTTSTTTGNNYTDTIVAGSGSQISYDNDVAPIAGDICEAGGVIFTAKNKIKIKFPFDFEYYCPITITNQDGNTYQDAIIRIRLGDEDYATDPIENLEWDDFENAPAMDNLDYIRIFDTDLTTPLNVVVYDFNSTYGSNYIDIFIRIPQLVAGEPHIIYLCWTPKADQSDYDGVSGISAYQSFSYGEFFVHGEDDWADQEVWGDGVRVLDGDIVTSPVNIQFDATEIENKSDTEFKGNITSGSWQSSDIANIPAISEIVGLKSLKADDANFKVVYSKTADGANSKGYFCGYIKYNGTDISSTTNSDIFTIEEGTGFYVNLGVYKVGSEYRLRILLYAGSAAHPAGWTSTKNLGRTADTDYVYFVMCSWNFDDKVASLFQIDENGDFDGWEGAESTVLEDTFSENYDKIIIGKNSNQYDAVIDGLSVSQIRVNFGTYLNGSSDYCTQMFKNMSNFMPAFETMVGWNYALFNRHVEFGDVETIEYKDYENTIKWSDVGNINFPDSYIKLLPTNITRIIPAPDFLQLTTEGNTVVAFGRNAVYRFILSEDPSTWASNANNIIKEQTNYGLYKEDTLVSYGNALYWLSESGWIRWSAKGLKIINKNKINLPNISDGDTVTSFPIPIRNQMALHYSYNVAEILNAYYEDSFLNASASEDGNVVIKTEEYSDLEKGDLIYLIGDTISHYDGSASILNAAYSGASDLLTISASYDPSYDAACGIFYGDSASSTFRTYNLNFDESNNTVTYEGDAKNASTYFTDLGFTIGMVVDITGTNLSASYQRNYQIKNFYVNSNSQQVMELWIQTDSPRGNSITMQVKFKEETYIYNVDYDNFTKFQGLNVVDNQILHGGNSDENYNVFLCQNQQPEQGRVNYLTYYPTDFTTSICGWVKKEIEVFYASFIGYEWEFDLDDFYVINVFGDYVINNAGDNIIVRNYSTKGKATVYNKKLTSNPETPLSTATAMQTKNLPLGYYGNKIELYLENADKIYNLLLKLKLRETRR